jgi:two-component system sensor histidine kinase/response regulator
MDGFDTAKAIRSRRSPAPRLIMLTAYGDDELLRRAVAEKLDGCLSKPVSASTLSDAIATACGAVTAHAPPLAAIADGEAPAHLRGRRVLLVEDNEFNQIVATELLADVAGMSVNVAGNGEEAVERLREARFDAVLMDVQMPVMDGFQATALIRQDPALATLPIIAMTAYAMQRDREKCLAVGMNDYVTKPFEAAELFGVLAKWLRPERPAPAADADAGGHDAAPHAPISFELGLQRCLDRRDLYEKILARYLAAQHERPDEIETAIADKDLERAARLAHSVISTAGLIGAQTLSDSARALQLAIDDGDTHQWPRLADALAREQRLVTAEVEAYFVAKTKAQSA